MTDAQKLFTAEHAEGAEIDPLLFCVLCVHSREPFTAEAAEAAEIKIKPFLFCVLCVLRGEKL